MRAKKMHKDEIIQIQNALIQHIENYGYPYFIVDSRIFVSL